MQEIYPDKPEVIAPPPLIFAAFLGAGLIVDRVWPLHITTGPPPNWIGSASIAVALLIAAWAAFRMRRGRTYINPRMPTLAIVADGPFAFTRNPLYLSLLLVDIGIGLLIGSVWVLILAVPLVILLQEGVIKREERYLELKFGEEYLRYKAKVRRWI